MNFFRFLTFSLCLVSFNTLSYEGELDKFFNLYEAGKIIEAVDSIYSSNRWIDRKSDDIEKLKAQFVGVSSLVGEYHGKTLLGKKDINERLISVTYMALYERQPVRLEFVFYRPKDKWVIYSFSYDDNIDEELLDASRREIAGY
ncbi:MAG: hypothetical protein ACJAWT_000778 [Glaciecola sp.]|jgi:hypothetical protein